MSNPVNPSKMTWETSDAEEIYPIVQFSHFPCSSKSFLLPEVHLLGYTGLRKK